MELASRHYLTSGFLASQLLISATLHVAGAWYWTSRVRYALPGGVFAPGKYSANIGGFMSLRERKVARIEILSSLGSTIGLAECELLSSIKHYSTSNWWCARRPLVGIFPYRR